MKCLPKERSDGKHVAFKKIIMETKEIIIDGVTYICTPKKEVKSVEHEFVDLGLPSGRLWATCNIGAKKPTDYGDYFACGAVEPYNINICDTISFYYTDGAYLFEMNDAHDCAKVLWGDNWRMPTIADFNELIDNCAYDSEIIDGIMCGVFTSKANNQKIVMPAAGSVDGGSLCDRRIVGGVWSRSFGSQDSAWGLFFNSSGLYVDTDYRHIGCSVRPVRA